MELKPEFLVEIERIKEIEGGCSESPAITSDEAVYGYSIWPFVSLSYYRSSCTIFYIIFSFERGVLC